MNNPNLRAVVTGTGGYLPARILTNDDLSKMVDNLTVWPVLKVGVVVRIL